MSDGPLTHFTSLRGEKYRAGALGLTMISENIQIFKIFERVRRAWYLHLSNGRAYRVPVASP